MTRTAMAAAIALLVGASSPGATQQDTEITSRHGEWAVYRQTDPIDDGITWGAVAEGDAAAVHVVCRPGQRLELLIVFEFEYIEGSQRDVIYRIDQNETIRQNARVTFSGSWSRADLTLNLSSERDLEEAMMRGQLMAEAQAGSRLAVRVRKGDGLQVTKLFPLSGFTAAARPVFSECAYEPGAAAARERIRETQEAEAREAASAVASKYQEVRLEAGEEFEAAARTAGSMLVLYVEPGNYRNRVETLTLGMGVELNVLRRAYTGPNDSWVGYWYLVELADGRVGWTNPTLIEPGGRSENG